MAQVSLSRPPSRPGCGEPESRSRRSTCRVQRRKVWEREWQALEDCLLTVIVWGALEDSEMTGQQVRLWRLVMRGWEARLDG
jgi:hypothetical protein